VLKVELSAEGATTRMKNAVITGRTATVTWPVSVWFDGRRSFTAELQFGRAGVERVTYDPQLRFPDRDFSDNTWPRPVK
jgi:hypothetical protein